MNKIVYAALTAVALTACTDEEFIDKEIQQPADPYQGYVFPNSPSFKKTQSRAGSTFETDWENYMVYQLPSGQQIPTPWSPEAEGANSGYHKDIKREDGWVMLYHNLSKMDVQSGIVKNVVFYNQRTGYLKIFIYNEGSESGSNHHYWQFSLSEGNQALTNAVHPVAAPIDFRSNTNLRYNSSVDAVYNGMISYGWNMTEVPLAYDPNLSKNISMHIGGYASTTSTLELYLELLGSASGTIVSDLSSTPSLDPKTKILNYTSEKAKEIAQDIFPGDNVVEKTLRKLISGGLQQLIKKPINLFFDKFLGGITQNESEGIKTINLTYQEKGQIKGTITEPSPINRLSTNMPIGESFTGVKLGAWNLSESPTVYIHPVGVLQSANYGENGDENPYRFCASGKYKVNVVFNPELVPHIKSYRVECTPVFIAPSNWDNSLLPDYPGDATAMGSLCKSLSGSVQHSSVGEELIGRSKIDGVTQSRDNYFSVYSTKVCGTATYWNIWDKYGKPRTGAFPYNSQLYKYIYAPSNNDIIRGGRFAYTGTYYYLKVSLYTEMEFEGKIYNNLETRTYKPHFEWDPSLVSLYDGMDMRSLYFSCEQDAVLQKIDPHVL